MKNRNVFWLGIVSFFTDMSSDMIFPVLPIFLSSVLGVPKAMIGLIDGFGEAVASLLKGASGVWSDRIHRRKKLVVIGYSLSTIVKPFFALIRTGPQALLLRGIERAGKGIRTAPRDALITESVSDKERGRAFGFQRALDTSGAVLGTLIAFLFLWYVTRSTNHRIIELSNYHTLFLLSFIPGVIAVVCLLVFVRETVSPRFPEARPPFVTEALPPVLPYTKQFKKFLFVSVLFQFGSASYSFFVLKAHDIGIGLAFIPLVYLVYSFIYALLSKPMGKWSDKIGRHKVLPIGFLAFSLTSLGFAFSNSALVWLFIGLYGVSLAITDGVSRAYVADINQTSVARDFMSRPSGTQGAALRSSRHGATFGLYHMATGLASLAGAVGFGFLWDRFGATSAFTWSAILSALVTFLFLFFSKTARL